MKFQYPAMANWRPLFEENSVLLPITTGCSHNACKFCDMYHEEFAVRPIEDIKASIDEMAHIWIAPIPRIFLECGNVFHLDAEFLLEILNYIQENLPRTQSVGCFARIEDISTKTNEELKALRAAGMDMLSIGAESGLDTALARMNKGQTSEDILAQCQRLETADIHYALFYLAGIAGKGHGIENARATVEVFSRLNPEIIMVHTMTAFEGTVLAAEVADGSFELEPELEVLDELIELYSTYPKPVRMLAKHVSNTVRIDGYLPIHRDEMVDYIATAREDAEEGYLETFRKGLKSL